MRHILDASAVLALLQNEPGDALVAGVLSEACVGSVNLAEVVTVLTRKGRSAAQIRSVMQTLDLPVLSAERSLAIDTGLLWPATKVAGSSLGDRYALALARRMNAGLLTSDERLAAIAPSVGVRVIPIR